jgi:hypothetical protein
MPEPLSNEIDIQAIAAKLNTKARQHPIGDLQRLRKQLKGSQNTTGDKIFTKITIRKDYAFHYGGRTELQFNIGIETNSSSENFRHGVAFSLKTSRAHPNLEPLYPKVARFNDFLRQHGESLSDFKMWHFEGDRRIGEYQPKLINPEIAKDGNFIFLGRIQPRERPIDYEAILSDFDRLLPLYEYVESKIDQHNSSPMTFEFRPGPPSQRVSVEYTRAQLHLDFTLRHNLMQQALYKKLVERHGEDNVGAENPTFAGYRVDLVVREADKLTYYEIKAYQSPRACIREALGQLLEYSCWPGRQPASRLVVVGATPLNEDGRSYLIYLNKSFRLNLEYQSISILMYATSPSRQAHSISPDISD